MGEWTNRAIKIKEKLSKKVMMYSLIVFVLSILIFNVANSETILIISGFALIISGAIIALFIVVYFILKLIESINKNKEKKLIKKTIESTKKKKPVKKKIIKKPISKKRK